MPDPVINPVRLPFTARVGLAVRATLSGADRILLTGGAVSLAFIVVAILSRTAIPDVWFHVLMALGVLGGVTAFGIAGFVAGKKATRPQRGEIEAGANGLRYEGPITNEAKVMLIGLRKQILQRADPPIPDGEITDTKTLTPRPYSEAERATLAEQIPAALEQHDLEQVDDFARKHLVAGDARSGF